MKRAIVVGSEGQDGRLLFDRLVADGCEVLGIGRKSARASNAPEARSVSIEDREDVMRAVNEWTPEAVFYLAAVHQSSEDQGPADDFRLLERSFGINVGGVARFLDALKGRRDTTLFYAASSMVFGEPDSNRQDENTPFRPTTPYGITKAAGIHVCRYYREHHGVRASTGILYNHESPLRRANFVSQKIARGAVAIARGDQEQLVVGDLGARVDWGYAPDFIDAMIRIASQPVSDDYVVATGEAHSVLEFVEIAFMHVGLNWREHVVEDRALLSRNQVTRVGDSTRLRERTGWSPTTTFAGMVEILVDAAGGAP